MFKILNTEIMFPAFYFLHVSHLQLGLANISGKFCGLILCRKFLLKSWNLEYPKSFILAFPQLLTGSEVYHNKIWQF